MQSFYLLVYIYSNFDVSNRYMKIGVSSNLISSDNHLVQITNEMLFCKISHLPKMKIFVYSYAICGIKLSW